MLSDNETTVTSGLLSENMTKYEFIIPTYVNELLTCAAAW